LGLVAELLQNGGFLPQLGELYKEKAPWFSRKTGLIFSALWFIFFVMMMPAFFGIVNEDEVAGISAVFGVFTTMMFLIISLAFLKSGKRTYDLTSHQLPMAGQPTALYGNPQMGALPPQQTQPASTYMPPEGNWRAPDTGDLARPGSVTEATTRLLKKDEK
jgi:hypothetical protein